MKKRSASHSAFLNLRVLFGLFVMLAGVFLALVSFGTFSSVFAQTNRTELTHAQVQPVGVAPSESAAFVWSDNRNDLLGGAPRKDPNKIVLTPGVCDFQVLIAYADTGGQPFNHSSLDLFRALNSKGQNIVISQAVEMFVSKGQRSITA